MSLKEWVQSVDLAFSNRNGIVLSRLLNPNVLIQNTKTFLGSPVVAKELVDLVSCDNISWPLRGTVHSLDEDMVFISESILTICGEILKPSSVMMATMDTIVKRGIRVLMRVVDLFDKEHLFRQGSNNWLVPVLLRICQFLISVSGEADEVTKTDMNRVTTEAREEGVELGSCGRMQQEVLNAMRQHIGKCQRNPEKANVLVVLMAQSIQRCIALGNLKMAAQFTKTLNMPEFIKDNIIHNTVLPKGPLVTFMGSIGILEMQQSSFVSANEKLSWAVQHIGNNDEKYDFLDKLIVVRMRLGMLPTNEKLKEYGLYDIYGPITQALRTGDIKVFEDALQANALWFMKQGTLLIVERAKYICYRTFLFRSITIYQNALRSLNLPEGDPRYNQIPMDLLLTIMGPEMEISDPELHTAFDIEELGSVLSSVISSNLMKGYIAWQANRLVLSKKEAFPNLELVLRSN